MKQRMLINTIYKLIFFPGVLYFLSVVMPGQLRFAGVFHWLAVSLLLLVIGIVADEVVLPLFGVSISTMQGAFAIILIIYLSGFVFPRSMIALPGAIIAGISLSVVEFIMHYFIREQQKKEAYK